MEINSMEIEVTEKQCIQIQIWHEREAMYPNSNMAIKMTAKY